MWLVMKICLANVQWLVLSYHLIEVIGLPTEIPQRQSVDLT